MEQYRLLLYCARFFAAAALIFYFVTSCTNYWLHAVTCQTVNDTLEAENLSEADRLQGSPASPTESVDNATDLRSGIVPTFSTETIKGSLKSSEKKAVLSGNGLAQYQRRGKKIRGGLSPLWLKDYRLNYHHEGFFWRCSFSDKEEENQLKKFIYIYQPPLKCCIHAFHSPFPNVEGRTTKEFESSISYRKLWSALMFLGVIFVTIGFLCIIYYACCQNHNKYKTTGVIFLIAGVIFTLSIIMYAVWISAVSQMIAGDIAVCNSTITNLNFGVNYGWSFMAAPFAVLFSVISGLLFIKIAVYRHSWSVLLVLSVLTIGIGFGLIAYEALHGRESMYILGGGFFLLAGTNDLGYIEGNIISHLKMVNAWNLYGASVIAWILLHADTP